MKLGTFALIFLPFLLVGCGPKGSSSKLEARISDEEIKNILNHQHFECDSVDGAPCPSGIARLFIINKSDADKSHLCTGFMVGEDTLVTNNHCVPSQSVCDNTYVAIYNGFLYIPTKCSRLVKTLFDYDDKDPRKKLDVSIIKLQDNYLGKIFKPAKTKASVNEGVSVWVVDHTGQVAQNVNAFDSRITEFRCKVLRNEPTSSMMLESCPLILGNSGSPVLNKSGEIVGVIWGTTTDQKHINARTPLSSRRKKSATAAVTDVIYFRDELVSK